ncbi:MAG: tRNA (adenosine(37)-N6)-dimethylallyltransferase MiaA [Actinobacteria bacterium]|nr:tRNA (adenosine(37)-N6)-dimethylallyltransferase MiaA [Actinomycetota bacterium]
MDISKTKLVAIVGPTGVGKSDVAIELATQIGGEVISADSMQVYKGMDIGTAKVTPDEIGGVPHHLIDIIDPAEPFSVAEYQKMARQTIDKITMRGKIPVLVGGTGLYIRATIDKLEFPAGDISSEVRKRLEQRARDEGPAELYKELVEKDPAAAGIVHPNNTRRIIRALEVIELTGRPFSDVHRSWKERKSIYNLAMFGLIMDREKLRKRINQRVDLMIEAGLLDEVKALVSAGYEGFLTSQQAIGYKELIGYLKGEISLEEATDAIKAYTRQYAKRQLTWFRADPRVKWIDVTDKSVDAVVEEILTELKKTGFIPKG